jgi:predicted acetyltransferase
MAVHELELRYLDDDDAEASERIGRRAFGFPAIPATEPPRLPTACTGHGAFLDGTLVGRAFDLHDRQWWGGTLIGAADIAGVAVVPEARGNGVARRLITRLLADAHERGAVVSALFPSISTVYRALGWVTAGRVDTLRLPTLALPRSLPDGIEVREGTAEDTRAVHDVYTAIAKVRNGMLSRDEARFAQPGLTAADGLTVASADGVVVGYSEWTRGAHYGERAELTVHDLLATTPRAAGALAAVLSSWHTVVPAVRLHLLGDDTVADCLPHELGSVVGTKSWMHRPVDIAGAVARRGWPTGVQGKAVFALTDRLAPWNTGTWALEIADGAGALRRTTADTSVGLTVAGFASLYCGLATAGTLREAGHVTGPPDDATALDVLGTSAPPRILDSF